MREVLRYGEHAGVITPLFSGMKGETYDYCRRHPEVLRYARDVFGTGDRTAGLLPMYGSAGTSDDIGQIQQTAKGKRMPLAPEEVQQLLDAIQQLDWVVWVKQQMGQGSDEEGAGLAMGLQGVPNQPEVRQYQPSFPGPASVAMPAMTKRSPTAVKPRLAPRSPAAAYCAPSCTREKHAADRAAVETFQRQGEKLRLELDGMDATDPERYALQERIADVEAAEKGARAPIAEAARKLALARGLSYEAALSLVEA